MKFEQQGQALGASGTIARSSSTGLSRYEADVGAGGSRRLLTATSVLTDGEEAASALAGRERKDREEEWVTSATSLDAILISSSFLFLRVRIRG